jgi:hypothetical protein
MAKDMYEAGLKVEPGNATCKAGLASVDRAIEAEAAAGKEYMRRGRSNLADIEL